MGALDVDHIHLASCRRRRFSLVQLSSMRMLARGRRADFHRKPKRIEWMAFAVSTSIVINRPIEDVFAVLTNVEPT
jgi:hypothetical protein